LCSDENYDLIEESVSLQESPISRNGSFSSLINSPFASDVENIQDLDDVSDQNEINVMSPDGTYHRILISRNSSYPMIYLFKYLIIIISAQLNDGDSDDSVFPFMRRRANVLNNHFGDENEELYIQEEYQCKLIILKLNENYI